MKRLTRSALPVVAIAVVTMLGFGCTEAEQQEIKAEYELEEAEAEIEDEVAYENYEWDEGVKFANKGYDQLDDFDTAYFKDEPERAKRHLEKAAKDFDKALTHFAKAEVGLDGQEAIKDLNAAIDQLNTAYNEFDVGNIDSAESHYNKAID
jgi:tetratricopeptide (TPR) repeat protein